MSVVIPAYNEEAIIASVVTESLEVLPRICSEYEVIVADDASLDATGKILDELAQKHPRVRVIHNPHNRGTAATLWTLYRAARCEWICSLPADGQVRAADIPRLVGGLDRFDIVVGHRKRRQDPRYRLASAWLWNLAVRALSGVRVRDVDSVKLYPRELFANIEVSTRSAFMETEILLKAKALGYRMGNVEVTHHPRQAGRASGVSVPIILHAGRDLIGFWLRVGRVSGRVRPGELERTPTTSSSQAHAKGTDCRKEGKLLFPLLILLAALIFFSGLFSPPLDGDEMNYAAIAKRMLERKDWMTPYFYRSKDKGPLGPYLDLATGLVPMLQKTPLGIWLIGLSLMLFGQSEFAVRLPSALLAIGIVGLTYALARLLTGSAWQAFLAGMVLLTSQPFLMVGQSYTLDSACIFLMVLAAYFHLLSIRGDRRVAALVGPSLGLAFFAKPFVPLLALPVFFLHLAIRRHLAAAKNRYLWIGFLLGVLINAPWFVYEYWLFGPAFLREFFLLTVGTGVARIGPPSPDIFFYRNNVFYYVRHLLVFYLPWALLLPAAIWHCSRKEKDPDLATFPLLWGLIIFGVFTLSVTRLPHYIAPIYPVLAIPLGVYLDRLGKEAALGRLVLAGILAMVGLRIGYLLYALLAPATVRPGIPLGMRWWVGLTVALGMAALLAIVQRKTSTARVCAVLTGIYLTSLAVMASYNLYWGHVDPKSVRDYIAKAGPGTRVVGVAEEDLSLTSEKFYWYLGKVPFATEATGLKRLLHWPANPSFIIADEWGGEVILTAFPNAVMRLRFLDDLSKPDRELFLFELKGREAG